MISNWPIYFKESLLVGNKNSNISICTLWLSKEKFINHINRNDYCVIGNLFSRDGINYLIRNVLANPKIRYIIVCGNDRSESGKTLIHLFKYGIDDNHKIKRDGFVLQSEIDISAINLLREKVKLVNKIGTLKPADINRIIQSLKTNLPAFSHNPLYFPDSQIDTKNYPSEINSFVVRGDFVVEVWLKLLDLVASFGIRDRTEYSIDQIELIDVIAVISRENPDEIQFVDFFPFRRHQLEGKINLKTINQQLSLFVNTIGNQTYDGYFSQILTSINLPDVQYTYGQRLLEFNGINQIDFLTKKLREVNYTKRAIAVLWNPEEDITSGNPPCLILIQFRIIHNQLCMTAYFRSHDIYRAWPSNAFALRKLQSAIAKEIDNVNLGDLIIISQSAHIYEGDWQISKMIVNKYYKNYVKESKFVRDPRGGFYIYAKNKKIYVNHYTKEGKLLNSFEGTTAKELFSNMSKYISRIDHAFYLGTELKKAEIALDKGLDYEQDQNLKIVTNKEKSNIPKLENI